MKHFILLFFITAVLTAGAQVKKDSIKSKSKPQTETVDIPSKALEAVTLKQLENHQANIAQYKALLDNETQERDELLGLIYTEATVNKPDSARVQSWHYDPDTRKVIFKVVKNK